ncbi:SulP family inorganic anion transporter [Paraburkholderia rhizosphaerae]|uniref:High affinity sulfate transporter 1 n=1 Tax=Paraburkholderia rhizosphaerae TaxID=480658 RepID=A0A4R8LJ50_9BURK|nr:SulP family inorganic anion transporter [Paraburkholderia rhizosphaerae]TDY43815.1 high affinity sulfate transporter 1 [Paraburkholderia rhizosphaerae]
MASPAADRRTVLARLARLAPGLASFVHYRRDDLRHDIVAGVCVASVALPVGVAYAELAGFNPAIGLYSCLWPLVAYALFGTSRQLIVGPDAATCALIAAALTPFAAPGSDAYLALSATLTFVAGLICIAAGWVGLGACADFLSRPILTGFMNGIAISIALGQVGKLLGFKIASTGIIRPFIEIVEKIGQTHWPTLAVGSGAFALLIALPKLAPRVPTALATLAIAAGVVGLFSLDSYGVRTIGAVPPGLPWLTLPTLSFTKLDTLVVDAAGIALISFCSAMLTARSFAARNHYEIDDDREFAAIGAANIVSSLTQGFAISGADSRTAMNDMAGGRTQMASLVAAASIGLVLVFLTKPLQYVPTPALGAVLVMAAVSLVDLATLRTLWRESRSEFFICISATLGVVLFGSLRGILLAVVLALFRFIRLVARPSCEVLGTVEGMKGFHSIARHADARQTPGLCLFRFNAPIVFFNARHFRLSVLNAIDASVPTPTWFVLDAITVTSVDVTGRRVVEELREELGRRGVTFVLAGRRTQRLEWREKHGLRHAADNQLHYPTLRAAVQAFHAMRKPKKPSQSPT